GTPTRRRERWPQSGRSRSRSAWALWQQSSRSSLSTNRRDDRAADNGAARRGCTPQRRFQVRSPPAWAPSPPGLARREVVSQHRAIYDNRGGWVNQECDCGSKACKFCGGWSPATRERLMSATETVRLIPPALAIGRAGKFDGAAALE